MSSFLDRSGEAGGRWWLAQAVVGPAVLVPCSLVTLYIAWRGDSRLGLALTILKC
jgi:hypothetical protein